MGNCGHHIIEFLIDNGYGKFYYRMVDHCLSLIKMGKFESFKLIYHSILDGNFFFEDSGDYAAMYNDIDMLKWFIDRGFIPTINTSYQAARSGNLELLKYVIEFTGWDTIITKGACEKNRMNILLYALENGCLKDKSVANYAALHGKYELLQECIKENNYVLLKVCSSAGSGGHFNILMYLLSLPTVLGKMRIKICTFAVMFGHIKIVKYLCDSNKVVASRLKPEVQKIEDKLIDDRHYEMLLYLSSKKIFQLTIEHFLKIISNNDYPMFKWVITNKVLGWTSIYEDKVQAYIVKTGQIRFIRYLHSIGYQFNPSILFIVHKPDKIMYSYVYSCVKDIADLQPLLDAYRRG